MRAILLRPRWMLLTVVVGLIVALFITLGLWQLRRLDERRVNNAVLAARIDRAPVTLADVRSSGLPPEDLEYTVVRFTGVPQPERSVFVRSQTHNGEAGTHQVVPVVLEDGSAVLVNLGWQPLNSHPRSINGLEGPVDIEGFVRPTQARPGFGQAEPAGELTEIRRIDIARLQEQFDHPLVDFWVLLRSPDAGPTPPHPVPPPQLDEGAHLSYAVQWFSFALISVLGFALLIRRERASGTGGRSYVVDDEELLS